MPVTRDKLLDTLRRAYRVADRDAATSALGYLNHVVIDSKPNPRPFREAARPWQWALARRLLPAFEHSAGLTKSYDGPKSFWLTLPKGHDKTGLLARLCNWILAYPRLRVACVATAKDKEQANYLADSMEAEAALNPWFSHRLQYKHQLVYGQYKSTLKVLAADAAGYSGAKPDVIVCDEVTFWGESGSNGEEMFHQLYMSREKRDSCIFLVITNAGVRGSWQWEFLQKIRTSSRWWVYEAPHQLDTWMSAEAIEELRHSVPRSLALRLFDNQWIAPGEADGLAPPEDVKACEDLGRERGLFRLEEGRRNTPYLLSVDYGPVKDRTVLCLMHRESDGTCIIDRMDVLQGSRQAPVQVAQVEAMIDEIRKKCDLSCLVLDPYQMVSTEQKYRGIVPVEVFEARGGKSNYALAESLRSALVNRKVLWYPGCGDIVAKGLRHTLADEINELLVRPMSYGYRITNLPNKHDDRAVAVGMALVHLLRSEPKRRLLTGDFWF